MLQNFRQVLGFGMLVVMATGLSAQDYRNAVIPQEEALRHGLRRAWITHAQLDRTLGRIEYMSLHGDILIVQTSLGAVHVLEAETGGTRWVASVGNPDYPNLRAGSNDRYVAVCNGSTLYVLSRDDGHLVWERSMLSAPSGGVAMSRDRVYVPMMNGVVASYSLRKGTLSDVAGAGIRRESADESASEGDEAEVDPFDVPGEPTSEAAPSLKTEPPAAQTAKRARTSIELDTRVLPPQLYQATGMSDNEPLTAHGIIAWGTSRGFIYAANMATMEARFRFATRDRITAPLAYHPPYFIAASRDGYVMALHEQRGVPLWQFSAGTSVTHQPVALEGVVYVIPETGGMFCLDASNGDERWYANGVVQFLAASPTKIYAADRFGRMLMLDPASGARLDTMSILPLDLRLTNSQSDRIYLATATGIVQCLREVGLDRPAMHMPPQPLVKSGDTAPEKSDAGAAAAAEEEDPFEKQPAAGDEEAEDEGLEDE